jgi:predicted glutamine amidotransferase
MPPTGCWTPDSLEVESRRNVDGTGIGYFDANGVPVLDKRPEPAYRDPDFIREAIDTESEAFVGHVRLRPSVSAAP